MSGNYDTRPDVETISLINQSFNLTPTFNYVGPRGKRGLVTDIIADITTGMVGTTSVPEIDVGTAAGDASYARYRLGAAAGSGYGTGIKRATQDIATLGTPQVPPPAAADFPGHVALETAYITKDIPFVVTLKAGTGGTPAGIAHVYLIIKWF
jgi:hypothetical protein